MGDETTQPGFKFATPIDAFRQARRYIVNNALRRRQRSLNLSNYGLTELPPEIGQLKELQNLDLSDNQLSILPPEIGGLLSLQSLHFGLHPVPKTPS